MFISLKDPTPRRSLSRQFIASLTLASCGLLALSGCSPQNGSGDAAPTASAHSSTTAATPDTGATGATASSTAKDKHSPTASATGSATASAPADTKLPVGVSSKELSDPRSIFVIVNKERAFQPKNYAPQDLVSIGHGQQLRAQAAHAFQTFQAAAARAGHPIVPTSGYRSYSVQEQTFQHWVQQFGKAQAVKVSAEPGHSEHQSGWAVDVMPADGRCRLERCFGTLPAGRWVAEHAHEYGFILRYLPGKEAITGYSYEPWHFRYVGSATLATEITQSGKTMEEFFGLNRN